MVDVAGVWQHEHLAKQRLMEDWYSTYHRPYHQYCIRTHAPRDHGVPSTPSSGLSTRLDYFRSHKRRRPMQPDDQIPTTSVKAARKLPSVHTILASRARPEERDVQFPATPASSSMTTHVHAQDRAPPPAEIDPLFQHAGRPTLPPVATYSAPEVPPLNAISQLPPLTQSIDHACTTSSAPCEPCVSPREMASAPTPTARVHLDEPKISPSNSRKRISTAAAPPSGSGGSRPQRRPVKTSRYLREMDRREILARVDQGEKQSALAKEFQVSRAAICNLVKHRGEILARIHENPYAKHPKKPRKSFLAPRSSSVGFSDVSVPIQSRMVPIRPHPSSFVTPPVASEDPYQHYQYKPSSATCVRVLW